MLVCFDPAARATYVQIHEGRVASTLSVSDTTMVDVDEYGSPIGVEFLQVPAEVSHVEIEAVISRFPDFKVLRESGRWVAPGAPRVAAAF